MEKCTLVLSVFLIEIVVDIIVLNVLKIHYKKIFLLFMQIPKVCASVICMFYLHMIWVCVLAKILAVVLFIIFVTDSFKIKKLVALFVLELLFLFSISGFAWFILLWIRSLIEGVFLCKIAQKYQFILIFALFLYIFAIFKVVRFVEKNRFIKNFLAKVSLNLNGKHIYLYGLIDSGNSLFDTITRKPIILISRKSLEQKFSRLEVENILKNRCRKIKCETVSGSGFEIPIFKADNVDIVFDGEVKEVFCMVGIVNHEFEKGKFDCLLHRDFL